MSSRHVGTTAVWRHWWSADGRWRPASDVVAVRIQTKCGEYIVRQTALSSVTMVSSVVSFTAHTEQTPSWALQDSQHRWSLFNNEKFEKSRPQFEHSGGYVTSSHTIANRWNQVNADLENWVGWLAARLPRSCSTQPMYQQWLVFTYANL